MMLLWRTLPARASAPARVSINTWLEMPSEVALTTVRPGVLESVSLTVTDPVISVLKVESESLLPASGFSVRAMLTIAPVTA